MTEDTKTTKSTKTTKRKRKAYDLIPAADLQAGDIVAYGGPTGRAKILSVTPTADGLLDVELTEIGFGAFRLRYGPDVELRRIESAG